MFSHEQSCIQLIVLSCLTFSATVCFIHSCICLFPVEWSGWKDPVNVIAWRGGIFQWNFKVKDGQFCSTTELWNYSRSCGRVVKTSHSSTKITVMILAFYSSSLGCSSGSLEKMAKSATLCHQLAYMYSLYLGSNLRVSFKANIFELCVRPLWQPNLPTLSRFTFTVLLVDLSDHTLCGFRKYPDLHPPRMAVWFVIPLPPGISFSFILSL